LRSGYNDLGAEFAVPRKVRTDTIMTTTCTLQDAQREIEARQAQTGVAGRDRAKSHYPSQMMERLPQRGN